MKKIGIIGGAGPLASSLLIKNIVAECYAQGCKNSCELPEIVLINYPFSFEECMKDPHNKNGYATVILQKLVNRLNGMDVELLVIACNTLHLFLPHVCIDRSKLVHIVHAVASKIQELQLSKLLVLGSPLTTQSKLYDNKNYNCFYLDAEKQKHITTIIKNILRGIVSRDDMRIMRSIIEEEFMHLKLDGVILGCTELPVLYQAYREDMESWYGDKIVVLDTINVLAKILVEESSR